MQSVGEVTVCRAAGRGQQISEGRGGGAWLLVRKKEVNSEIIIYSNSSGII